MHIVLVNRCFPPHTGHGGIATYHYNLAKALVNAGHRVSVVAARWSSEIPEYEIDQGVAVHRLWMKTWSFPERIPFFGKYMRAVNQVRYSFKAMKMLKKLEKNNNPDVIEFAEAEAESFFYLVFGKKCPVVVRCHTPLFILKKFYKKESNYFIGPTAAMEKYCILKADFLTAPSKNMAETVAFECGIERGRIAVIPNGLDPSSFESVDRISRNSPEVTVLHVGRLDRLKGIEVLAEAIFLVSQKKSNVKFIYAGDDRRDEHGESWKERLSRYFNDKGIASMVELKGEVTPEALKKLYQQADIAIVPSMLYESFSYTCAQAMASGLPVIASRIGGISETVDDRKCGILVEPNDPQALALSIIKLVQEPETRKQMGAAGREKAQKEFDARVTANENLKIYSQAKK